MAGVRKPGVVRPYEDLGTHIAKLRRDAGFSQRDFARAADVTYGYLSKIEAGIARPDPIILRQIATALQTDYDVLADFAKYRELPDEDMGTIHAPPDILEPLRRLTYYPAAILIELERIARIMYSRPVPPSTPETPDAVRDDRQEDVHGEH